MSACGVFCLTPVAVYLVWLGSVNRKDRPTVVGGVWDLVGVLAAVSGFVLFGGALLVAGIQSNARFAARGNWDQLRAAWDREQAMWLAIAGGYLLVAGGSAVLGLVARSRSLSVYNTSRERVEAVLDEVLTGLGVNAARYGNIWSDGKPIVGIDVFYGLRHVTVWVLDPDPQFRQEFERDFRKRVGTEVSPDNPVGPWFTSAAVTVGMTIASCLFLMVYISSVGP